jgi:hypothetical protein
VAVLLADIREAFAENRCDRILSADLVAALVATYSKQLGSAAKRFWD